MTIPSLGFYLPLIGINGENVWRKKYISLVSVTLSFYEVRVQFMLEKCFTKHTFENIRLVYLVCCTKEKEMNAENKSRVRQKFRIARLQFINKKYMSAIKKKRYRKYNKVFYGYN